MAKKLRKTKLLFALVSSEPATVVRSRSPMEALFWFIGGWAVQEHRRKTGISHPPLYKPQKLIRQKKPQKQLSYLNSSSPLSFPQPTPKTSDGMKSKFIFKYSHKCGRNAPGF